MFVIVAAVGIEWVGKAFLELLKELINAFCQNCGYRKKIQSLENSLLKFDKSGSNPRKLKSYKVDVINLFIFYLLNNTLPNFKTC